MGEFGTTFVPFVPPDNRIDLSGEPVTLRAALARMVATIADDFLMRVGILAEVAKFIITCFFPSAMRSCRKVVRLVGTMCARGRGGGGGVPH